MDLSPASSEKEGCGNEERMAAAGSNQCGQRRLMAEPFLRIFEGTMLTLEDI